MQQAKLKYKQIRIVELKQTFSSNRVGCPKNIAAISV
jgi:hypothetical protein